MFIVAQKVRDSQQQKSAQITKVLYGLKTHKGVWLIKSDETKYLKWRISVIH